MLRTIHTTLLYFVRGCLSPADLRRYDWEPEVGLPQECTLVVCQDFAPNVDSGLNNRLSDLVSRFRLWYMCGGDDVSSFCVSLGLFDQALSQPALLYMGILVVAGVRFDVSGQALYPKGVWAGSCLMVSVDTYDGDLLPVTTVACLLIGGSGRCGWLLFVTWGQGLWLLQSACEHAPSCTTKEAG